MSDTPSPLRRARRAHHRTSPSTRVVVLVLSIVTGLAAIPVDTHPTGNPFGDKLFTLGFAALVAFSTSYARRWTWPILAAGAALVADGTPLLVVAGLAVAASVVSLSRVRRSREVGALVGAMAVQVLLRQDTVDAATYLPTLVTAVVCTPIFASAYHNGPNRVRRRTHIGLVAIGLWFVVGAIGLAFVTARARGDIRSGIDLAIAGLDAGQQGDQDQAAQLLREASARFDAADATLSSVASLPARLIPLLGNNANALETAADQGAKLTGTAARTAELVDLDALAFRDGRIDLAALIRFDAPLADAAVAAETALAAINRADSPWLLGPIDSRLSRLVDQLDEATPALRSAADVVQVAPAMLGADEPRRYLVLFITPSELRGLGGFVGGFAEILASEGAVELVRTGRPAELNELLAVDGATLDGPDDYIEQWSQYRPTEFFQDITLSPHFPSVADVASQLYEQATGVGVDGVIALDPIALAAFTELTGPVDVAGRRLLPRELADFLLHDQYLEFATDEEAREDLLDAALRSVFTDLFAIDAPSPRTLALILGPVVDSGRLMMVADRPEEQVVLDRIGTSGAFPDSAGSDLIAVVAQNSANNKIDWFLQRSIDYTARVAGNGRVEATVTIQLTNNVPPGGGDLPPSVIGSNDRGLELGLNRSVVTLYTPHGFESANIDGTETGARLGRERGVNAYSFTIDTSAGQTRVLTVELLGVLDDPDHYELVVAPQPTANPDRYSIDVMVPNGNRVLAQLLTPEDVILSADR